MPHHITHEETQLTPTEQAEAAELIVTAYRDDTPPQPTGAAPVPQPDKRIVPPLAAGIAVGSAGVGVGAIGLGLGAKLVLGSITPDGVAFVSVLVGGGCVFTGCLTGLIAQAKKALAAAPPGEIHHHHNGPTRVEHTEHTEVHTHTRGLGRTHIRKDETR